MGAAQIAGSAVLLGHDLDNTAGFVGKSSHNHEGQFMVYFMSHSMIFCAGTLLEANIVLTTASCVYAEYHKFPVYGGSHKINQQNGIFRMVDNLCLHRSYPGRPVYDARTSRNVAILLLSEPFPFGRREPGTQFLMTRVRYSPVDWSAASGHNYTCYSYGWGSRRNGILLPLSMDLMTIQLVVYRPDKCQDLRNNTLCIKEKPCRTKRLGVLCPDDLGSPLICNNHIVGMMQSSVVNRPCGYGYLNMTALYKFLTCAVDDSVDMHKSSYFGHYISDPPHIR